MQNINTKEYWEQRFSSGDWLREGGNNQTRHFAEAQVPLFQIPVQFNGTICDFGCGTGDAFPVYRSAWPLAKLRGVDFSRSAIHHAKAKYGEIAEFIASDVHGVPESDFIISSNVFEHLEAYQSIARELLRRCKTLFVVVPFQEDIAQGGEHVNSFDSNSFDFLGKVTSVVFECKGWSLFGFRKLLELGPKNLMRPMFGRKRISQKRQILFRVGVLE